MSEYRMQGPSFSFCGQYDGKTPAARWLKRFDYEMSGYIRDGQGVPPAIWLEKVEMLLIDDAAEWSESQPTIISILDRENPDATHVQKFRELLVERFPVTAIEIAPLPFDIELNQLRQLANESLSIYYKRAQSVLTRIGGKDRPTPPSTLLPVEQAVLDTVIRAFTRGLLDTSLQSEATKAMGSHNRSLKNVYAMTESARMTNLELKKLQDEQAKERELEFYKNLAHNAMAPLAVEALFSQYQSRQPGSAFQWPQQPHPTQVYEPKQAPAPDIRRGLIEPAPAPAFDSPGRPLFRFPFATRRSPPLRGELPTSEIRDKDHKVCPDVSQSCGKPPLLKKTIGEHLQSVVAQHGDREAVISRHQQARLTYDALDRKSDSLAKGLLDRGVRKGDRVAVSLGNSVEYAVTTYGLFKIGAILVPLNPSFNAQQTIAALTLLKVSQLIIGAETNLPRKEPRSNVELLRQLVPDMVGRMFESEVVPSLKSIVLVDNSGGRMDRSRFRALAAFDHIINDGDTPGSLPEQDLDADDIVNIQFTSGTTSMPKAACLSHRSILNNGKSIGDRMLLTEHDIVCCPPPLFHCFGCILGYMATATHGSAIVFPCEAFDPHATLKSVQEEKCTALYGVPTMFIAELEMLQNGTIPYEGFQHLRTGIAAGSSIPAELMRKLHKILNLTELTICYGMTETFPVSAMTTTDDPLEKRINSVGRLLPHIEAKIIDPSDRTRILPTGKRGELAVSGYLVMKGYWGAPERTAEVMIPDHEGKVWMHTGDEAEMDEEGYIRITGRIKDIIIKGGENIHPLEVENCLLAHPGVREVSVVGLPDERYGEVVAAFVIRHMVEGKQLTEEDVKTWVRDKLSHHLVPRHIFWTDNYPKTASGKIQKFKLREEGIALIGAIKSPS